MASWWLRNKRKQRAAALEGVAPEDILALPYYRISGKRQERGMSLQAQKKETGKYIKDKEWDPGEEFCDVERGTEEDRRDYQRLLGTVRRKRQEGRAVVVVSVHLDRYGRDLGEQLRSDKELKSLGVPVHYTRMGGTLDHDQVVMHGWMAEKEVQRTGERVSATKQLVADLGLPTSGPASWGYVWRPPQTPEEEKMSVGKTLRRVLDEDPDQGPAVAEAFRRAADGATLGELNRWASSLPEAARGTTYRGRPRSLARSVLSGVLRNPLYVSRYDRESDVDPRDDPEAVLALPKGKWPALTDDATWLAVQRRFAGHRDHPHQASGSYLLSGFIWCPQCAADGLTVRMVGARSPASGRSRDKTPVPRYRCTSYALGTGRIERRCSFTAPAALLEEAGRALLTSVIGVVTAPRVRSALERQWAALRTPQGADAKRLAATEQLIARLRQRIRRAREDLYDDRISREEFDLDTAQWRNDLTAAERERDRLRDEAGAGPLAELPPLDEALEAVGGWRAAVETGDIAGQRNVLAFMVERAVPVRVARGVYRLEPTWTPAGEAFRRLAEVLAP